uniref:Uncharacterized protein n=1 Tax=Arundo donax TaxID=35708 RepID=A0A0A8YEX2_ARUDO
MEYTYPTSPALLFLRSSCKNALPGF